MPWFLYISIGAAIGLWIVIRGWNPANHPPDNVTSKSILGVLLGAAGSLTAALVTRGLAANDPMPARSAIAALATAYVFSGIGTFLGTGRATGSN